MPELMGRNIPLPDKSSLVVSLVLNKVKKGLLINAPVFSQFNVSR
jgi:hypothetical protein